MHLPAKNKINFKSVFLNNYRLHAIYIHEYFLDRVRIRSKFIHYLVHGLARLIVCRRARAFLHTSVSPSRELPFQEHSGERNRGRVEVRLHVDSCAMQFMIIFNPVTTGRVYVEEAHILSCGTRAFGRGAASR